MRDKAKSRLGDTFLKNGTLKDGTINKNTINKNTLNKNTLNKKTINRDALDNNAVYKNTRDLYKLLSEKLGDKEYFYNSSPSTLDAIAFSHLALHSYPSLSNPILFSMLAFEFPTLIKFINRIKSQVDASGSVFASSDGAAASEDVAVSVADKMNRVENFKRILFGMTGLVFFGVFLVKKSRII